VKQNTLLYLHLTEPSICGDTLLGIESILLENLKKFLVKFRQQ